MASRVSAASRDGGRWLHTIADVFKRRPYTANVVGGGIMGGVGDGMCQMIFEQQPELNRSRLGAMVLFGAGYVGGACTLIYSLYVTSVPFFDDD